MAKFGQKVKRLTLTFADFWTIFEIFLKAQKGSLGLKKRFYLRFSFIGRIFLEKMDFEKSPKNGQISAKSKEVTLNFLTILDHFWDFLKRLKKASLGLEKRFYLGLSFIGRIFLQENGLWKKSQQSPNFAQK